VAVSCPRCGGPVRPLDVTASAWRCDLCGPVPPLHIAEHLTPEVMELVVARAGDLPIWCPWPLPPGWMVTGVGWAGDDRGDTTATVLACAGPAPLGGTADVVLVAEEPGLGLGNRFAALAGPDPGPYLKETLETAAHAKVKAAGWPTPLWAVGGAADRSAYVGEARGRWLYAVTWPANAGYLFADEVVLHDLTEWLPTELIYGAASPYLSGGA
jgi:hypothetical protein